MGARSARISRVAGRGGPGFHGVRYRIIRKLNHHRSDEPRWLWWLGNHVPSECCVAEGQIRERETRATCRVGCLEGQISATPRATNERVMERKVARNVTYSGTIYSVG